MDAMSEERIWERLNQISDSIGDLRTEVAKIAEAFRHIPSAPPASCSEHAGTRKLIEDHLKAHDKINNRAWDVVKPILTAIIQTLGAGILALLGIKHLIK